MAKEKQEIAVSEHGDPKSRRYVGVRETAAYVAYDMSQSFNINGFKDRFIDTILQISYDFQSIALAVNGVWDIVNDLFIGAIVEKTNTRWGKFKPYLMFLGVPGMLLSIVYWLLPLMFSGSTPDDMRKFAAYLALMIITEGVGTFQELARTGIMATITPFTQDRTRLIAIANLVSGALGEDVPRYIMKFLTQLMDKGHLGGPGNYPKLYIGMGTVTAMIAGIGALWFFFVCKERVAQTPDRPSFRQSIRIILHNRPLLCLTLSDTLGAISLGGDREDYLTDVLHFPTLDIVSGIPSVPINWVSYALVPKLRRRFSDRFLYIFSTSIQSLLCIPMFGIGCIGGKKKGLYTKPLIMGIVMAVWEMIFTVFYGTRKCVPAEIYNESMDYCEWTNGFRGDAMISVTKGLTQKVGGTISRVLKKQFKKWIKYDQLAFVAGKEQSTDAKFWLFALWTIIPAGSTILGMIPMFFYNLDNDTRDRMYAELQARRAATAAMATENF